MSIRIKTFGYKDRISPLKALEKSFEGLGCQIVDEDPDLIFDLTGWFTDTIEYSKKYPKAIKIFNLLNVDINNPNWGDGRDVRSQLLEADIVTTVSESTKRDIKERTGVDCEVIYFPIKKIVKKRILRNIEFLYVGRLFSAEKRFENVVQTMNLLGYPGERLIIAGPEDPNVHPLIGRYVGLKNDKELNALYNQSRFLLCPCEHEGSLCVFEAIFGDCIPILSVDNNWSKEFSLEPLSCDPDPISVINKTREIESNYDYYLDLINKLKPGIIEKFSAQNVAKRIIKLYNR